MVTAHLVHHLTLTTAQARLTAETMAHVLAYAAVQQTSVTDACSQLAGAPADSTVRYQLAQSLPASFEALERQLNEALQAQLPARLTKRAWQVACDLTEIPYHGKADVPDAVRRGKAKAGTSHFHTYATAYLLANGHRYTLALTFVQAQDKVAEVLARLRARLAVLQLRIRRLYLDRQFYQVEVLQALEADHIPYLIPLVLHSRQAKALQAARQTGYSRVTVRSAAGGAITVTVGVVGRNRKGRRGKQGRRYELFVVGGPRLDLYQLAHLYRRRFGIERSYRQLHRLRMRTSSPNSRLRLLYVGLGFLCQNLWIWLQWACMSLRRRGSRLIQTELLRLTRFCRWIATVIEHRYGLVTLVHRPQLAPS
jgi:putative transposase